VSSPVDPAGPAGPSGLPVGDLPSTAPATVDLPVPESALAVGAHPDDIEFGCGATLARWADAGCRVHFVVLTDGSKGTWDPGRSPADLAAERMAECRDAVAVVTGGPTDDNDDRLHFLDRVDGELVDGPDERRDLCRVIRTVRPAVVLGHDPWRRYRLHPDHRAAGFLTVAALVAARDPHFFPGVGPSPHRPEALLLWEPDVVNHVERADGHAGRKVDALLCHRSQHETTLGIGPGEDDGVTRLRSMVAHQLAAHGAVAGLASGEAFHLLGDL